MPNPMTSVERFYDGLGKLQPLQWLSTVLDHDIVAYEKAADPGREAIAKMADAPPDSEAESALIFVRETADEVVRDLLPDLGTLRDHMRPHKAGAQDLSEDAYETLQQQVQRRVRLASLGLALADHLTSSQLAGLYGPFERLIPLSSALATSRDFERDLALAILVSSRWASLQGPGSPAEKFGFWRTTVPRWLRILSGAATGYLGIGVPNMPITMGLAAAMSAFLLDGGAKPMRYKAILLVRETELRVDKPAADIKEHLAELRNWHFVRYERRWLARHLARIMEAMLWREMPDGTKHVNPAPKSLRIVGQALEAMGFEAADVEPPAPPGGILTLPAALPWWQPKSIDIGVALVASKGQPQPQPGESISPPEAQRLNTALVAEPGHLESAVDWYRTSVLPYVDDYAYAPASARLRDIGHSRFSTAIAYERQPAEVRLLLWALADAMLVAAEAATSDQRRDAVAVLRLSLIRSIWWSEVHSATRSTLGMRTEDNEPDIGDPTFASYMEKFGDAHNRVESGMLRFLKRTPGDDELAPDGLSSFQIVMAARAAAQLTRSASSARLGCAGNAVLTALAVVALGQIASVAARLTGLLL